MPMANDNGRTPALLVSVRDGGPGATEWSNSYGWAVGDWSIVRFG